MREACPVLGRRFAINKKRKRINFDILKGSFQRLKSRRAGTKERSNNNNKTQEAGKKSAGVGNGAGVGAEEAGQIQKQAGSHYRMSGSKGLRSANYFRKLGYRGLFKN